MWVWPDDIAGEWVVRCRDGIDCSIQPGGETIVSVGWDPSFAYRKRTDGSTRHSSISLVSPVRTFRCTLCFTFVLTTVIVSNAIAQESSTRRHSVRQSERVARAAWTPTRPSQPAGGQGAASDSDRIGRVDHQTEVEGLPVMPAPAKPSVSVIETPIYNPPLDGQISFAPLHDGAIACDALPSGECGCGVPDCTGCDSGCDSLGGCGGSCGGLDCSMCGELCSPAAWRPCVTLCLPQDGWASFEYLGWWQDGMNLPPLVTTSVDPNVPRAQAGVLTDPSTRILFGGGDVLDRGFDGGRLRFGVWMDRCHKLGVGAEYFQLGSETESFNGTSTGNPVLARPFFNTQTGLEDSGIVAFPGVASGTVNAEARSELVGAAFNFRHLRNCDEGCSKWLFCGCPEHFCGRTEAILGYRFLQLEESVRIRENMVSTDTANPGTLDLLDRFDTRNQFNGFDVGWIYRRTRCFWTFDTMLRLAVGNTRQTVTINGQTTVNDPNDPPVQTLPGGLLAQTSNIGTYRQDEFAVVPEFSMNVGYQLTDHLRMTLGYNFIYWSNVVRPGDQISPYLNPNLFPPPADPFTGAQQPAFAFDTTDYWVQGINFGGEFRW